MSISNYKELIVWQKSMLLVKQVYLLTENFPKRENYSLTDQIRRAAISIPSNIAEGFQRQTSKEFVQFLYHSFGSSAELETQLLLSVDLNYLNETNLKDVILLLTEIQKMLKSLIKKTKNPID